MYKRIELDTGVAIVEGLPKDETCYYCKKLIKGKAFETDDPVYFHLENCARLHYMKVKKEALMPVFQAKDFWKDKIINAAARYMWDNPPHAEGLSLLRYFLWYHDRDFRTKILDHLIKIGAKFLKGAKQYPSAKEKWGYHPLAYKPETKL